MADLIQIDEKQKSSDADKANDPSRRRSQGDGFEVVEPPVARIKSINNVGIVKLVFSKPIRFTEEFIDEYKKQEEEPEIEPSAAGEE